MKSQYALMALILAIAMPFDCFAENIPQELNAAASSAPPGKRVREKEGDVSHNVTSSIPKPPIFTPAAVVVSDPDYGNIQATDITILPEKMTTVEMSNSDVNRITCSGPIEDLIFSSEKGLDGNFVGDNAFIKFKIAKKGTEKTYSSVPSELFVACQGKIYSMIVTPKRIPSATIRLSPGKEDVMRKNMTDFEGMPFEKKVLRLLKQAYKSKFPDSYLVRSVNLKIEVAPDLEVILKRIVDIEGVGFRIKEFVVSPKGVQRVEINEKLFMKRNIGEKIAAIAIDEHVLKNGKSTRVFVIEAKEWQS